MKEGEKAPDFTLKTLDGKTTSLKDLRKDPSKKGASRVVLLDFWATWCGPCRDAVPFLQKMHEKYGKDGLAVVGVSLDQGGERVVKPFVERHKVTYPMLLDPRSTVKNQYKVRFIPTAFLIGKDGIIKKVHIGFSPTIEKALEDEIKALLK